MTTRIRTRFPKTIAVKGKSVQLRLLDRADESELLEYFRRLPVDERQMLKDDVTNPRVIRSWCAKLDYKSVLPMLALEGPRIIASTTLHRTRGGWSAHVAKLRITIDAAWRGMGLGTALVREMLDAANTLGVAIVDAEVMAEQKSAIRLLEHLDFVPVATLPHHVVDLTHQPHDLVVYSRTLTPVERLSPDAWKSADEVDEGGGG
jgi:acetyltransferase